MLSPSWFSELGMDDPIFTDQCDMTDAFDEDFAAILADDFQISPENGSPTLLQPVVAAEHPQNPDCSILDQSSHNMDLGDKSSEPPVDRCQLPDGVKKVRKGIKKASSRAASQTHYDHTLAERKRREQLSLSFAQLTSIVPGLKKMDKSSILGDAIKYLKQLQEKVKILEEKARKQTTESVVIVKKSHLIITGDMNEIGCCANEATLPEIEARVCDKNILLSIHCEEHKGVMIEILRQIDEMNLVIVNTSTSRFGTIGLHISIIAEMEKEFNGSLDDILTSLRSVIRRTRRVNMN